MTSTVLLTALAVTSGVFGSLKFVSTLSFGQRRANKREGEPTKPVSLRATAFLGRWRPFAHPTANLEEKLLSAGVPYGLGVSELLATKFGTAVLLGLLALPFYSLLPGNLPFLGVIAVPLLGFYLPDLHLRDLTKRRCKRIEREFADVLELVKVVAEAGFGLERAFREVSKRHHGLFASEMALFAQQLSLGVPAGEALKTFELRCPFAAVRGFTAALKRTLKQGTPLSQVLTLQAQEARSLRATAVREKAAKASPKIQLLLALVMAPSVVLLAGAGLVQGLL